MDLPIYPLIMESPTDVSDRRIDWWYVAETQLINAVIVGCVALIFLAFSLGTSRGRFIFLFISPY